MRLPTLDYESARRLPGARFVDLRSPAEFERDRIPGARNVPLLDDAQRAIVGTLYKRESPAAAVARGLELAGSRLPELVAGLLGRAPEGEAWRERFRELARDLRAGAGSLELQAAAPAGPGAPPALILHCWRGGMRSRSVVALLHALGERHVLHLAGGFKEYRAWVRTQLAAIDPETPLIVLRGPTGVGKTRVLERLEAAEPGSTIDLEGLAGHRSSILGDIGLQPVTGMAFESRLVARLGELGPPPWFIEGESRKVGDVIVPAPLFAAMEAGIQVRLDAPLPLRVRLLREDYLPGPETAAQLAARLPFLEKRLGPAWVGQLRAWLDAGEWERVAETLLERYYDPLYSKSDRKRTWSARMDASAPDLVPRLLELRQRARSTTNAAR
ncbi:MAG TPA: tRNA 2-selenouridine(34) synthase MnmH [Planctomycetota bacterium]